MNIDYDNPSTLVLTKMYNGTTEDGKSFIITASWNEWDDWAVDSISWDGDEGTNDEETEITNSFLKEMNG